MTPLFNLRFYLVRICSQKTLVVVVVVFTVDLLQKCLGGNSFLKKSNF